MDNRVTSEVAVELKQSNQELNWTDATDEVSVRFSAEGNRVMLDVKDRAKGDWGNLQIPLERHHAAQLRDWLDEFLAD